MARSARDGLLTLSDRYGRIVSEASTVAGFTTVVAELPLAGRGGATLYDRVGDVFGWLCLALGIGLLGASWWRGARVAPGTQAGNAATSASVST